jgi:hypothetical protein
MKTRVFTKILALLGVALLVTSCETVDSCGDEPFISTGKELSYEEMLKMPPFTAKVENISIDHPFFLSAASVAVWLKTPESSRRLNLEAYPANPTVMGFVHSLHVCQTYEFPQVYLDYVKNQGSNAPALTNR